MTETDAMRLAEAAAAEASYPWNPATAQARRYRAMFLFPVWRVTSTFPGETYFVRVKIPNRADHATQIEWLSTDPLSPNRLVANVLRLFALLVPFAILCGCSFYFGLHWSLWRAIPGGLLASYVFTLVFLSSRSRTNPIVAGQADLSRNHLPKE